MKTNGLNFSESKLRHGTSRSMACRSVIATTLISLVTSTFNPALAQTAAQSAAPESAPITFYEFRDPNTQELIRLQYQPSAPAHLRKFSPKKMKETYAWQDAERKRRGIRAGAMHMAAEFPAEWLGFTLALALSSSAHMENDPAALAHFWDQNITDPMGYFSFAGFIAGSRMSHAALRSINLAYDPLRAEIDYRVRIPEAPAFVAPTGSKIVDTAKLGEISATSSDGKSWRVTPNSAIATTEGPTSLLKKYPQGTYFVAPSGQYVGIGGKQNPLNPAKANLFQAKIESMPGGATKIQKLFAPLVGPLGLSAGMFVSNVMHEMWADVDFRACAKSKVSLEVADGPALEACERAYENWALSKKAVDYVPDMLSMAGASLAQAYVINKGAGWAAGKVAAGSNRAASAGIKKLGVEVAEIGFKGAGQVEARAVVAGSERFIPWVLRGVQVTRAVGSLAGGPTYKLAMMTLNVLVFMETSHLFGSLFINPYIKTPLQRSLQGRDITKSINVINSELDRAEKNGWVWQPRPLPALCDEPPASPEEVRDCSMPDQPTPGKLLKKLGEKQKKWREFLLAQAYAAHKNWQDYVGGFTVMYTNAYSVYKDILENIRYMAYDPRAKQQPSYYFTENPFFGVYAEAENKGEVDSAMRAVGKAREWLEGYIASTNDKRPKALDRSHLGSILLGLQAIDPEVPLNRVAPVESEYRKLSGGSLTKDQLAHFEASIRNRQLEQALRKLRTTLESDPVFKDADIPFGTSIYTRMAETNPYMKLRLLLGNPEPLRSGLAALRRLNDDEMMIAQETRDQHPMAIGRARTNTMVDYVLASMVCGPELDIQRSAEERIKIYQSKRMSTFERLLLNLGLNSRPISADDPAVLVAVREYDQETARPEASYIPNGNRNALATEWKGIQADFRPPRIVTGVPAEICQKLPANANPDKSSTFNIHDAEWIIGGKRYKGMLDIVKDRARVDLIGMKAAPTTEAELETWQDPFEGWWDQKVNPHITVMVSKFRQQYKTLVEKEYLPVLTGSTLAADERATIYNGRSFKLSVLESLYDDAQFNLNVLRRTLGTKASAKDRGELEALGDQAMTQLKDLASLVSDLSFVERSGKTASTAFEAKRKPLVKTLEQLAAVVGEREKTVNLAVEMRSSTAGSVNAQALKNLQSILGEMDSYWGIVRGIQIVNQ